MTQFHSVMEKLKMEKCDGRLVIASGRTLDQSTYP